MQNDNRETETKVEESNIYEKYMASLKDRPLSEFEKEDIFMVRWITQAISGMIICTVFLKFTQNDIWLTIMFIQAFIYPIRFWRSTIRGLLKSWWNLLRGRRA